MEPTRFKQRMQNEECMIGFAINYPAAGIIENIGRMWDFLWLDGQHGQISCDNMMSLVRTADLMGADTLVRVPARECGTVGYYADMMPTGLMIPMIDTPDDAVAAVEVTKFPPLGKRSYGGRRPIDMMGRAYYRDHEPLLIAQIETPEAVKNVHAIAQTEGIDILMLGPDDLRTQMGLAINSSILETPVLLDAMEAVAVAAREAGKQSLCITPTPEMVRHALSLGYRLFVGGTDSGLLNEGSSARKTVLQEAIGNGQATSQGMVRFSHDGNGAVPHPKTASHFSTNPRPE